MQGLGFIPGRERGSALSPGLSHNVTDKEAEACGDGVLLSADQ